MKTELLIITSILMLAKNINAQITYEHTYPAINGPTESRPIIINMGNNDYKYMYIDFQANQLRLFNMDHSNYFTVNVPIPLINTGEYTVGYVTKSLFDCDTTMFEYAIFPLYWYKSFYIYRQDGTLLFQRDSTIAPWCYGCYNGSYDIKSIYNTPAGAKLFLYKADASGLYQTADVYSLCGTLPTNAMEETSASSLSFVKVFPNPASQQVNFEITLPDNINQYELVILNGNSQELRREKTGITGNRFSIDVQDYRGGIYYYSLISKNKTLQTGKFVLTK